MKQHRHTRNDRKTTQVSSKDDFIGNFIRLLSSGIFPTRIRDRDAQNTPLTTCNAKKVRLQLALPPLTHVKGV